MWSGRVAIYRLLRREVFEPEDLRLLAIVYEDTAKALGVTDQNGPVRELIARKLIALAQAGERDPDSLKELTIDAVQRSLQ
jgi:hypothetical protein